MRDLLRTQAFGQTKQDRYLQEAESNRRITMVHRIHIGLIGDFHPVRQTQQAIPLFPGVALGARSR